MNSYNIGPIIQIKTRHLALPLQTVVFESIKCLVIQLIIFCEILKTCECVNVKSIDAIILPKKKKTRLLHLS